MAAEGFVASEAGQEQQEQPQSQRAERPERQERPERSERPQQQRTPRPDREERPQRERERRPADDVPDNELPSFLHVPIKEGKPEAAAKAPASPPVVEAAPARRVPRPRKPAVSDDATPSDE
jgi:hypothetical protein